MTGNEPTVYEAAGGMEFPVGPRQAQQWLVHMSAAVDAHTEPGPVRDKLMAYFRDTAEFLMNRPG